LELSNKLNECSIQAVHPTNKVTDRQAFLCSSRSLFRTHAAEFLNCDLTSTFGFGTLRHSITAVPVAAGNAHFEEVLATYDVPATFDRAIA
jgi:hypothetical protein